MRLLLVLAFATPALAQWARDLDPGMAQQMLLAVEEDLARILAAPPADRPRLVDAFIAKHGSERIEAIKRFRNPELKDLFLRLLKHEASQTRGKHSDIHKRKYRIQNHR